MGKERTSSAGLSTASDYGIGEHRTRLSPAGFRAGTAFATIDGSDEHSCMQSMPPARAASGEASWSFANGVRDRSPSQPREAQTNAGPFLHRQAEEFKMNLAETKTGLASRECSHRMPL